jgi:hypothetical protein
VVAHPRPATANAEPILCNLRGSSSEAEKHHVTRAAAITAALGAASRARPESLKASTHHNDRYAFRFVAETPSISYQDSASGRAVGVLAALRAAPPRCEVTTTHFRTRRMRLFLQQQTPTSL